MKIESFSEKEAVVVNETEGEKTITLIAAGDTGDRMTIVIPFTRTLKPGKKTVDIIFDFSDCDIVKILLLQGNGETHLFQWK